MRLLVQKKNLMTIQLVCLLIYLVKKNFTQEDSIDIGVTVDGITEDAFVNISFVYGGLCIC